MSTSDSTAGRVLVILFMSMWVIGAITVGFYFIDFAASWPEGLGPSPSLFVWIPFAMAGIGLLVIAAVVVSWVRASREPESVQDLPIGYGSYDDVASSSYAVSGYGSSPMSYEIPPFCSQCGSRLDSENVTWAGPLHFKCPFCGKVSRAEGKRF